MIPKSRLSTKRVAIIVVAAGAVIYGLDFAFLHARTQQYGSVNVRVMYAVKLKNKETEYLPEEPQNLPCVNSLFPQMGYAPCWYLSRHSRQTVNVDAGRRDMILHTP